MVFKLSKVRFQETEKAIYSDKISNRASFLTMVRENAEIKEFLADITYMFPGFQAVKLPAMIMHINVKLTVK